ncbi:unnamed protein product [Cylindrotheca closterium]|uniref:Uncharacterized protein n=1 Tax=Cylindrotheca closterium TaxID=2856 RepID=A0AAD2G6E1_9STRA|nr:unnamed protein product [Cylindrotheca closterium]
MKQTLRLLTLYNGSSNVELLNSNEDACLPQQKKSGTDGICGVKETMATKQQAPRGLYSISNVSIEQKEKKLFARSHEVEVGLKTVAPMGTLVSEAEEHMKTLQHTIHHQDQLFSLPFLLSLFCPF